MRFYIVRPSYVCDLVENIYDSDGDFAAHKVVKDGARQEFFAITRSLRDIGAILLYFKDKHPRKNGWKLEVEECYDEQYYKDHTDFELFFRNGVCTNR